MKESSSPQNRNVTQYSIGNFNMELYIPVESDVNKINTLQEIAFLTCITS